MSEAPSGRGARTPARGTRPRNRRALITAAAAELFYRRGYHQVGMTEIADAVGVGPSALYRHFPGKHQLLAAVLGDGLRPAQAAVGASPGLDAALHELAAQALEHRELGVLWQRESRHLPAEIRVELRERLRDLADALGRLVREERPETDQGSAEVLVWCLLAVLESVSYHSLELPDPEYRRLVHAMCRDVVTAELPPDEHAVPAGTGLELHSRREALLQAAARLFARRGYAAVSIDDIGGAVGVAGPSVYTYFPSKGHLLRAAINRGSEALWTDLSSVLGRAADAPDALRQLVRSYVRFDLEQGHLIDIIIAELVHLTDDERHQVRQIQHDYIAEWVHLLRTVRPELDPVSARIRVQAVLTVVNDLARSPGLRSRVEVGPSLVAMGTALLRLAEDK
ncbi:TetR/AcrR family transcriptional regulator [Actinomadura vinacea]|uniref:TetR/AcrR family transcriptional regulator n=1 Tax=Actinomadura vinacea TaxID=115336 RepID=A0ABN3J6K7_9ACTN